MLILYQSEEFGKIRIVMIDNAPWFVGKDVAKILGYAQTSNMLKRIDKEDFISSKLDGMNMKSVLINESGFYNAVLGSKMPRAKAFRRWVTSKVLPTIRNTGGFVANEDMFIETYLPFLDEPYRNLFRLQMIAINKLNERIKHDQPLVEFANQVSNTDNLIDMNAMAKLARNMNIPIGRNRLFCWLRKNGILMQNNLPYQEYIERGYFAVKESVFETDSMNKTYQQTFVTGKGQQYIIGRLKNEF
ncbi:MAG: phage antirepressor Ant [Ruminococcus sp.]|nr:phage antirepressor Ant [Ruminococcus sp.]